MKKSDLDKLSKEELLQKHISLLASCEEIYKQLEDIDLDIDVDISEDWDADYDNRKQEHNEAEIRDILFKLRIAII